MITELSTALWTFWQNLSNLSEIKPEISVRYRWLEEEDENAYFEFIIHTIELTGSTALEITDFAEPNEKTDAIDLWDSQVEVLKRTLGI